jgi:SWI/SNF-related matrix-associated actin-dependent regulator of chromatin subfamily A-like protein 1
MLTFDATPERVRAATKLAHSLKIHMQGVQAFWAAQPRTPQIPGFAFQLKPYQADGVAHLEKWDGMALLADDPGLGKTAQVMAYAWKHVRFPMLCIMPKTLMLNWNREIFAMLGTQLKVQIVGITPSARRQKILRQRWPHVTWNKRAEPGHDVTLMNYDIVHGNLNRLEAVNWAYVVLDESHKIKEHEARRTQSVMRLITGREPVPHQPGKCTQMHAGVHRVTFLTGTPLVNRPRDLWTTVNTLAPWVPEFAHFVKFGVQFCAAHQTRFGWDFSGASNLDQLHTLLSDTIMLRRLKSQVLTELPAKTFVTVPLQFDRKAYDAVAGAFEGTHAWHTAMTQLVELGGKVPVSSAQIVAIHKCREIAALAKLDSAVEWITDYVEQGEKLVVFAHHTHMVEHVVKSMQNRGVGVVKIRGGVSAPERDAAAHAFQTDPDVKVIVCNITSAGFGITLTAARACVFLQLPWSAADYIQASDRVHRLGQLDNVTVYNLVAENTVEESQADLIVAKANTANQALDGGANQELADLKLTT